MRYRFLFGALLALGARTIAGCGGSSSETPPPLQPDPTGFRYAPPFAAPIEEEADAGEAPRSNPSLSELEPESNPKPRVPARSTWGASPAVR